MWQLWIGDHVLGEAAFWLSQVTLAVIAFIAAIVAWMQVRTYQRTELLKYIQSEEIRQARGYVFEHLVEKKPEEYSREDADNAARVAASYDVFGLVLRSALAPRKFFIQPWAPSVHKSYRILAEHLEARRKQYGSFYMSGFRSLYEWCAKYDYPEKASIEDRVSAREKRPVTLPVKTK